MHSHVVFYAVMVTMGDCQQVGIKKKKKKDFALIKEKTQPQRTEKYDKHLGLPNKRCSQCLL